MTSIPHLSHPVMAVQTATVPLDAFVDMRPGGYIALPAGFVASASAVDAQRPARAGASCGGCGAPHRHDMQRHCAYCGRAK